MLQYLRYSVIYLLSVQNDIVFICSNIHNKYLCIHVTLMSLHSFLSHPFFSLLRFSLSFPSLFLFVSSFFSLFSLLFFLLFFLLSSFPPFFYISHLRYPSQRSTMNLSKTFYGQAPPVAVMKSNMTLRKTVVATCLCLM